MCYRKPGPRCSPHTTRACQQAQKIARAARDAYERNPSERNEALLNAARLDLKMKTDEWKTSPVGLRYLGKVNPEEHAKHAEARRRFMDEDNERRRRRRAAIKNGEQVEMHPERRNLRPRSEEYSFKEELPVDSTREQIADFYEQHHRSENIVALSVVIERRNVSREVLLAMTHHPNIELRRRAAMRARRMQQERSRAVVFKRSMTSGQLSDAAEACINKPSLAFGVIMHSKSSDATLRRFLRSQVPEIRESAASVLAFRENRALSNRGESIVSASAFAA